MRTDSLNWRRDLLTLAVWAGLVLLLGQGCRLTGHPVETAALGTARPMSELAGVAETAGPVEIETVIGTEWSVPLSGLVNLDHEKARAAGLQDAPEPIHVYFHALRHPVHGLFLVDSGVERALGVEGEDAAIRGLVAAFMDTESMRIVDDTASWLERQPEAPAGVL